MMAYANERAHGRCDDCAAAVINGVYCHEQGCPSAWRTALRPCQECGYDFQPEERRQAMCGDCLNSDLD